MKLIVLIATLVACNFAVSLTELLHPSPINPNVLVGVKPEERIILITDSKEIAEYMGETEKPFYPTVLPDEYIHHRAKRQQKIGQQLNPLKSPPFVKQQNKLYSRNIEPLEVGTLTELNSKEFKKPHHIVVHQQKQYKRDIPVPLVPKHHHPEESPKGNSKKESNDFQLSTPINHKLDEKDLKQTQNLQVTLTHSTDSLENHKRDIPVSLNPKQHHPGQFSKDNNKKESLNHKHDDHAQELPKTPNENSDKNVLLTTVSKRAAFKESNEKKKEENKHECPNKNKRIKYPVQIEDLSVNKPTQQQI